jgi:hypothetical protein
MKNMQKICSKTYNIFHVNYVKVTERWSSSIWSILAGVRCCSGSVNMYVPLFEPSSTSHKNTTIKVEEASVRCSLLDTSMPHVDPKLTSSIC